jgi:hypothetical protein
MRTLASLLILMVAVHLQCGAQCLAEELKASKPEQPPCHQHTGNADAPGSNDADGAGANSCSQPTLESRIGPASKCLTHFGSIEPAGAIFASQTGSVTTLLSERWEVAGASTHHSHSLVLRI